ncbi:uncharacterized protein G2W53_042469 [Senna tora]|uniref:Uncharacterized protein n=1 Tax=Senna tora TaxID=362788 RepID=A0A834VZ09_9FABA|nr:uncharacterized protein G2W53_042469 [Senna tora]
MRRKYSESSPETSKYSQTKKPKEKLHGLDD